MSGPAKKAWPMFTLSPKEGGVAFVPDKLCTASVSVSANERGVPSVSVSLSQLGVAFEPMWRRGLTVSSNEGGVAFVSPTENVCSFS